MLTSGQFMLEVKVIYLLLTAKGKEWANQFIFAATANPGGPLAIVQNSTGVKITDIVVA